MRGKKAKQLRLAALNVIPEPNRVYEHGKPPGFKYGRDENGTIKLDITPGVPTKLGKCTRKVYKVFKEFRTWAKRKGIGS